MSAGLVHSRHKRLLASFSSGSAMAVCLTFTTPAWAACSPDPATAGSLVVCTGSDLDGLTVNTNDTTVSIEAGATVSTLTATTAGSAGPYSPDTNFITVNQAGRITDGLILQTGTPNPANYYAPSTTVTLNVASTGIVEGASGIALNSGGTSPLGGGRATIFVDNAGKIRSTAGGAAISSNGVDGAIGSLTNRATGEIGAIRGAVGTLNNSGTIDGGSSSAIATGTAQGGGYGSVTPYAWQNSGTILSNGPDATLDAQIGPFTYSVLRLDNSGRIANAGQGPAIRFRPASASEGLVVTNAAGGTISSAGGPAIVSTAMLTLDNAGTVSATGAALSAEGGLFLTNTGTITGSVVAGSNGSGSTINLTGGGTIVGNITLGSGNDRVIADYVAGATGLGGLNGQIDAGLGIDMLLYRFGADTTFTSALALPGSFEALGLMIAPDVTVTLGSAVTSTFNLDLSVDTLGYGTAKFVNRGTITTTGTALTTGIYPGTITVENAGTITANLGTPETFAVSTEQGGLNNSGTVTAIGGSAVRSYGPLDNSGRINATQTGVEQGNGSFTNSGVITSSQGVAVRMSGSAGAWASNTGTITGATAGVSLFGYTLTNSGTISASSGPGVALEPYATLDNLAGGVVNGGVGSSTYGFTFNTRLSNAGTINGNIDLGSTFGSTSNNTFIALDGGVVNGNLILGSGGDQFVTSLTNTGPGRYAGVTGTVTAGPGSALIYRVDADTTTSLASADANFAFIGYDLANKAHLTLNGGTTPGGRQLFSGTGTVTLSADLTASGASPLVRLNAQSPRTTDANALSLTSSGKLSATNSDLYAYSDSLIASLGAGSTFTNTGTITANDTTAPQFSPIRRAAIGAYGGTVINSGTITLGGTFGIATDPLSFGNAGPTTIRNSGTISQLDGAGDAIGVYGLVNLTNTGTISTRGVAVALGGLYGTRPTVTNSGTIASTGNVAISDQISTYGFPFPSDVLVVNQAGGKITGGTGRAAISLMKGTVDNAGTITGDVLLGLPLPTYYTAPGYGVTYISRGGTLNGNLTFGQGNDLLVTIDGSLGITGTIEGGGGFDTFAQLYSTTTTVDTARVTAPAGFTGYAVGASGAGTTVTVTGPAAGRASPIGFFGDGAIINQINVNAASADNPPNRVQLGQLNAVLGLSGSLDFSNAAILADGLSGVVRRFTNSGTIAAGNSLGASAVDLGAVGGVSFDFSNTGTITGIGGTPAGQSLFLVPIAVSIYQSGITSAPKTTISNSGTISGGRINASVQADLFEFTNSGTITAVAGQPWERVAANLQSVAYDISGPLRPGSLARFTNQAAGKIDGSVTLSSTAVSVEFTNAGKINGTASVAASATRVTASNSGTIAVSTPGAVGLSLTQDYGSDPAATASTLTVTNSGSIISTGGGVYTLCCNYDGASVDFTPGLTLAVGLRANARGAQAGVAITNAAGATIAATGQTVDAYGNGLPEPLRSTGSIGLVALAADVTLSNAGTITGGNDLTTALNVYTGALEDYGYSPSYAGGVQVYANTAALTNNAGGVINGSVGLTTLIRGGLTNYGQINGNVYLGASSDSFVQGIGATLTGTAYGGDGADTLTIDLAGGGRLDAQLSHFTGFETTRLTGAGTITATSPLAASTLVLDAATLTLAAGSTLQTTGPITLTGGTGASTVVNYGTIAGRVALSEGNDRFVQGITAQTGVVDGGGGTNSLTIDITGGGNLSQAVDLFSNFADLALTGTGAVSLTGALIAPTVTLNGAALTLASGSTLQTSTGIALTGGSGTNSFTNRGSVLGAIVDVETVNGAGGTVTVATTATSKAGFTNAAADASLTINSGTFTLGKKLVNSGLVAVAQGARLVDLAGISNLAGGRITIAQGGTIVDALDNAGTVTNAGTYTADLNNLAGGSVTNASGATWTGALANATGAALVNQGTVTGTVANAGSFTNATGASLSGALTQTGGSTTNAGTLAGGAVINGGSLVSNGTINGLTNAGSVSITGGTVTGTISNSGTLTIAAGLTLAGQVTNRAGGQINGAIGFGSGNDTLTLSSSAGVAGPADGGAGFDTLVITSAGSDAVPEEYSLARFTGFERTALTSGTIAVSGSYSTAQLDIQAGRYIGRVGSTLNAARTNVAAGASFGSGGTVNGDVAVSGLLTPGATVGTMTVNGNVAFANGSGAVFDVGSSASDQLLISGQLTIGTGTTLTLAGVPGSPLRPGSAVDLVVANGGITGSFSTVAKPANVLGFVVQRANRISLLGQFLIEPGLGTPTTAAIGYINTILTGGQANQALYGAIPSLLTATGTTNAAAFAQLTPEAYASATQIGFENGLTVAGALRRMDGDRAAGSDGLFVFAQGLGRTSQLGHNGLGGASRTTETGGGVLSGIGYGIGPVSLAGFVGNLGNRQSIAALGTRTSTDGVFVGGTARFASGALSGAATIANDAAMADTTRPVPGGARATSRYRLRSTMFDANLGYDIPLNAALQLHAQVGYTSVRTKRGTALEAGTAGAFDFVVARASDTASFIDGSLRLQSSPASRASFKPWLEIGVRSLTQSDGPVATGVLPGGPLGVTVAGVARARTVATVGTGFNAALAKNVTLFGSFDGGFASGTATTKANIGVRLVF